jgi:hypothetical protein
MPSTIPRPEDFGAGGDGVADATARHPGTIDHVTLPGSKHYGASMIGERPSEAETHVVDLPG